MAAVAAAPRPTRARSEDARWSRWDWIGLVVVFALALALRLLHLEQIHANDPFFANPSLDPRIHHLAAVEISRGDVFSDDASFLTSIYPYLLALIYLPAGPSFLAAKAVQGVMGAVVCALVFALGRQLFDRRVAWVAGGIAAGYSMLIFYGGSLLIANVLLPLTLLVLLCVDRALRRPGLGIWLVAGGLVGATALARATALIFAPLLVVWMLIALRDRVAPGRRLLLSGAFCTGVALVTVPFAMQLTSMDEDWRGGVNFFIGSNPIATGTFRPPNLYPDLRLDNPLEMRRAYHRFAEERVGRSMSAAETSAWWLQRGLQFVREEPLAWARLELRKLALFFNAQEIWNIRSHTLSRSFSWVLRLPLFTFGFVAPLAFLGMGVARREWRRLAPLYLMLGSYLAAALIFFVATRYRVPVVPVLILFAARALVFCFDAARERRGRALAPALLGVTVAAGAVHLPLQRDNLTGAYYNLGNRYKSLEAWDLAIESYRHSLAGNPRSISTWNNLALALEGSGDRDAEAVEVWRRVYVLAQARGSERHIERAVRRLRELGAEPTPTPPAETATPGR